MDLEPLNASDEAIKLQKNQKSRNRIFGLLVVISVLLLGVLVFEIVMIAIK